MVKKYVSESEAFRININEKKINKKYEEHKMEVNRQVATLTSWSVLDDSATLSITTQY